MIIRHGVKLQNIASRHGNSAVRIYGVRAKSSQSGKKPFKGTTAPLRPASTSSSPNRAPAISMTFGVSMILMGIAGWIYYPQLVEFEDRKRAEREEKALLQATKEATQQMPPSS